MADTGVCFHVDHGPTRERGGGGEITGPAAEASNGRFDTETPVVAVAVVVVSSTHAILALQVQVVRGGRVPFAQRIAGRHAAVLVQEPFVDKVHRPVDAGGVAGDGARRRLLLRAGRVTPAVRRPPAAPVARLAPQTHYRGRHGDGEQHHRRAAQHAHVHQAHAVPVRAVDRILVETHGTVGHAVAPEQRANARVQFRAPANNKQKRTSIR